MADIRYALVALITVTLLGCLNATAAEPKAKGPAPTTATKWVLERGRDIPKRLPRTPKLQVDGQKLSGSTGCNSFTAALVDKADKRIAIEQVALTRKLCAENLDRVEAAVVRALEQTQYLEEMGKRLTFLSEKREPLLVWTRNHKAATQRAVRPKRYARPRHQRRHARARHQRRHTHAHHHRRSASFVDRGCWGWLTGAPARRGRLF
jgi:heat shock protein HslJ